MWYRVFIVTALFVACASGRSQREFTAKSLKLQNNRLPQGEPLATHPDVGLTVPELVSKYGYPVETHYVNTSDGYILQMHRIPYGKGGRTAGDGPKSVVFLQHGLLCSSADWVLMGPEQGLGYLLADQGYDVWMGNARGNRYSRNHVTWNPDKDNIYWDFSWHEIGNIDLPTMIDHVLLTTGQEKVYYIGHSQGTTSFFVMTSTRPEYNDKVKLMIALAPVVYMENVPNSALRIISKFHNVIDWITDMLGLYEFLPKTKFLDMLSKLLCDEEHVTEAICRNILFLVAGFDREQLNDTMVPVIISNVPSGSSTKQVLHYSQGIKSGDFEQYDYGRNKNMEIYGQPLPPRYDLSKVSAPVALYWGANDLLSGQRDVERLSHTLPHVWKFITVPYDKWSHLDFLWAKDVVKYLYNDVINDLKRW